MLYDKLFHDGHMSEEERKKYHGVCEQLADAVRESLRMFLLVRLDVEHQAHNDGRDIHAAPLMMMLAFAEAIDGVSVLACAGSAANCPQLLRTAFEVQLGLRYVLEDKTTYDRRCLAYEYFSLLEKLKWAEKCDQDTQIGKDLRARIKGHLMAGVFEVKGIDVKAEIRRCETKTKSTRYDDVRNEIIRMKAAKQKAECWYSLWGGPKSVYDLADHFKELPSYEVMYRSWSSTTHGEAALKRIGGKKSRGSKSIPSDHRSVCPKLAVRHAS